MKPAESGVDELGVSLVPDESSAEGLLLSSLSSGSAVLPPDALPTGLSDVSKVSDASGTVDAAGGGSEEVAGTEDGIGTVVLAGGLTEAPTLGAAEGTILGATSLPLGLLDWDEQPAADPKVATDNSKTDV